MELAQLKYFLTVANCGQISQAASMLYVSQSGISMSISRLEKELGVGLFERKGRSLQLTKSGKRFQELIAPAMAELEFAREQIVAFDSLEPDVVSLSIELPDFATGFEQIYCKLNPEVRFRQTMDTTETVHHKLLCKTVDFALTFEPFQDPEILSQRILCEPALVQLSKEHPLFTRRSISLPELRDSEFVSFSPDYSFRRWTDGLCGMSGFRPKVTFEVCDTQSLMQLVSESGAAAFVGKTSWDTFVQSSNGVPMIPVRAIPLIEPHCIRNIYLSYNRERILTPAAKEFWEYALRFQAAFLKLGTMDLVTQWLLS